MTNSTKNINTTSVIPLDWKESARTMPLKGLILIFSRSRSGLTKVTFCSCQQILLADQPGASDSHGCPYRHFSPDNLQTALLSSYSSRGLRVEDLPEVMNAVKSGHFHIACTRVFELTHASYGVKKGEGIGGGESVTHPNQYAARSRELEKAKLGGLSAANDTSMAID